MHTTENCAGWFIKAEDGPVNLEVQQIQPIHQPARPDKITIPGRFLFPHLHHAPQTPDTPRIKSDNQQVTSRYRDPACFPQNLLGYFADIQYVVQQQDIDAVTWKGQFRHAPYKWAVVATADPHPESMSYRARLIQLLLNHAKLQQLIAE